MPEEVTVKVKFKKNWRFAHNGTDFTDYAKGDEEEVAPRCAKFALDCEAISNIKDTEAALSKIEQAKDAAKG